ncbi:MAG TPA: hypothetical protein PLB59_11215 [Bacteroidales bacterium]|nr:hypothetical protein [Bacteroidales bacterium]HNZ43961.1 hypothetical protein [Bacteroidales bacterium]HPB26192.1 hypothetical protein [Bacteroidales bacterium]HPI31432.1 hypothetical protein [Bacteroidales bacterium]HQN16999.1 hypothetical protein [Bacteroidales bacterium]
MKKTALILAGLLVVAISLSSCKKDWTCKCGNLNYTIENATKADAKAACDVFITGTTVCELQ